MCNPLILYIEDTDDDAFFMEKAFQRLSVKNPLRILRDGQRAIDYLSGKGEFADRDVHPMPSLLLLDLNLPLVSGLEVLEWIRKHPTLKNLNVVMVSASGKECDIFAANLLGVTDYVVKPPGFAELVTIVRERMNRWLASRSCVTL